MAPFCSILEDRARQIASLLCVGLDPHLDMLPEPTAAAAQAFCLRLIEATADLALAFKPNSAFFEALGPPGMAALRRVIAAVPKGIPVILDAKRGDIAATSRAYAHAAFNQYGAHAITVNPYLGADALQPFLDDPGRGVFVLCKTSNPGAAEFQDLMVHGLSLYEQVALKAQEWNRHGNVGLVVGATDPQALARVRALAPDMWLLVPGIGAQGGDLTQALAAGLRQDGLGMLITISRSLAMAKDPAAEARRLVETIRRCQEEALRATTAVTRDLQALAQVLLQTGCVRFGHFTLRSGQHSSVYLDLRRLVSYPAQLARVAAAYLPILRQLTFQRLAGLPYAALPIATAIALHGGWPLIYPRREAKDYGTGATIEGEFAPGEKVVIIDDVATTGGTKLEAIDKLRGAGLMVNDVVVLVDREGGAKEALAKQGIHLHAVARLSQLLPFWQGQVPPTPDTVGLLP